MNPSPFRDLDRPPLREPALRRALQAPDGPWRRIEVVAQTGSTNADLVARARAGEEAGLVLVADHQSAGRGRLARPWTTPPRAALAASVLLRPEGVPPARLGWLSLLAGVAVTDTLVRRCGLAAVLKWPNDVLIAGAAPGQDGERKVCGVLAEAVPGSPGAGPGRADPGGPAVVVGVGINVTQTAQELPEPTGTALAATSLRLAGAATTDRDTVLRDYLRRLADRYADFVAADGDPRARGLAATYRQRCATLGRQVELHLPDGAVERGTADEVDDDGQLVVRLTAGTDAGRLRAFAAGDVVHARARP